MGPIIVQVGRRATGLVFGLHPLSRAMIQSAFPHAKGTATTVSINFETLRDFLTVHGSIEDLAREVVPTCGIAALHLRCRSSAMTAIWPLPPEKVALDLSFHAMKASWPLSQPYVR
jgi:hypothetical protein